MWELNIIRKVLADQKKFCVWRLFLTMIVHPKSSAAKEQTHNTTRVCVFVVGNPECNFKMPGIKNIWNLIFQYLQLLHQHPLSIHFNVAWSKYMYLCLQSVKTLCEFFHFLKRKVTRDMCVQPAPSMLWKLNTATLGFVSWLHSCARLALHGGQLNA